MPYHHGDLRRTLLAAAAEAIAEHGPAAISLRDRGDGPSSGAQAKTIRTASERRGTLSSSRPRGGREMLVKNLVGALDFIGNQDSCWKSAGKTETVAPSPGI